MGSKRSKKSKKKSKESKKITKRHVNPFQIEDSAASTTYQETTPRWDGDYYWSDEEDEEQAGLLVGSSTPSHYESRQREQSPSALPRMLCVFSSLVFGFWLLLAATTRNDTKDNESIPAHAFPTHSPTNYPVIETWTSSPTIREEEANETPRPVGSPIALAPTVKDVGTKGPVSPVNDSSVSNGEISSNGNGVTNSPLSNLPNDNTDEDKDEDEWDVPDDGRPSSPITQHIRKKPNYFVVLGERHSGVDWMVDQLKLNCGAQNQHPVTSGFRRPGYWFQKSIADSSPDSDFWTQVQLHYTAVVIIMVRNPADWFRALYEQPDYIPNLPAAYKDFLIQPWAPPNATMLLNSTGMQCQLQFGPRQVVPCLPATTPVTVATPVYELSEALGSTIFPNVAALRAAKIRHWTEFLPTYWQLDTPLRIIQVDNNQDAYYNITPTCQIKNQLELRKSNWTITKGFRGWLEGAVDWKTEERIGYSKPSV